MASTPQPALMPKLAGLRVLIVQCQPPQSLALGATVARAGGHVTVARTRNAALLEIRRRSAGYDAAVIDTELPDDVLGVVVQTLRDCERPCLAVGLCSSGSQVHRQRAVTAGVIDLFVPPHRAEVFLDVLVRCAAATAHLRAAFEGREMPLVETEPVPLPLLRRPPHSGGRCLIDPGRLKRSDLEGRLRAFADGRGLSSRELCVLRYIAMGYRYDEIAAVMAISSRTVKMHAYNVRRKVGVTDRYQLLRKMYS